MRELSVVTLNGLNADSLGAYLASLGLFSLAAQQWSRVRAVWRNARFCLVGGPATLEQVVEFVSRVGERNAWTRYDRPWNVFKEADVKKKASTKTARWRALEAEERSLPAFGAHLALDGRVRMNPLLGTGGNAGKRDFAKGWKDAVHVIEKPEKPPRKWSRDALDRDLEAFLSGGTCTCLGSFQAGSWFGAANKIYYTTTVTRAHHRTLRAARNNPIARGKYRLGRWRWRARACPISWAVRPGNSAAADNPRAPFRS